MIDLDKLQQAAEAATPGPWVANKGYPIMISSQSETWPLMDEGEEVGRTGVFIANTGGSHSNAQFIAECDPQTILKLIAVARAAKTAEQGWQKGSDVYGPMHALRETLEAP